VPAAAPIADAPVTAVAVMGPAGGRWRAGRRFGPEPVLLARAALGDEAFEAALAAIRADPMLAAIPVDPGPAPAAD
jgi:hypothetical protein